MSSKSYLQSTFVNRAIYIKLTDVNDYLYLHSGYADKGNNTIYSVVSNKALL